MNPAEQDQGSCRASAPTTLVNLELYPIDKLSSEEGRTLVRRCREQLDEDGVCLLPDFLAPQVAPLMAAQVDEVVGESYRCDTTHNVYLEPDDDAFLPEHPRRQPQRTHLRSVAYDQIVESHDLRALYEWDLLTEFVAATTSNAPIFRMGDPLAALTINVMGEGQHHGWHFDESETTITLMLQAPLLGGEFEYVARLRRPDGEEYEAVGQILAGDTQAVSRLEVSPGTLMMFEGHEALHRVSPVVGSTARYVAVLCYKSEPGVCNSAEVQQLFYGRTA